MLLFFYVSNKFYELFFYKFFVFCLILVPFFFIFFVHSLSVYHFGTYYNIALPFYNTDNLKSMSLTGVENDMIYKANQITIKKVNWIDIMNETYQSHYNWKTDASFYTNTYIHHLDNL